jgi:hypothetical protein
MSDGNKSEVACFRQQQLLEEEAARRGLYGYAITARHDFIVARMQLGGQHILRLIDEGKHEEAQELMNREDWGIGEEIIKADVQADLELEVEHKETIVNGIQEDKKRI